MCLTVEPAAPMVGSAAERAVNVKTPAADGAAVASVSAGVTVPTPGGVGAEVPSSSSFCCHIVLHECIDTLLVRRGGRV